MLGLAQLKYLSQNPNYSLHVTRELFNYKPQSQADCDNFNQFLNEICNQVDSPLSKVVLPLRQTLQKYVIPILNSKHFNLVLL